MATPLEVEVKVEDTDTERRDDQKPYVATSIAVGGLCILLYFFVQQSTTAAPPSTKDNCVNGATPPYRVEDGRTANDGSDKGIHSFLGCKTVDYSKTTVKAVYELPFAALFSDNRGQKKFEASDVTIVGDYAYAVCDNSWAISKFRLPLRPFSEENVQIGNPSREKSEESNYEALFHHDNIFYAVRESVKQKVASSKKSIYRAVIEELELGAVDYKVLNRCSCAFEFEGKSKGFEGAMGIPSKSGDLIVLGLCEGNYCSEERKSEAGNGRIIVMRKNVWGEKVGECVWETVKILQIPSTAKFRDYSALSVTLDGHVGITSQEDSKLWLGQLLGIDKDGLLDTDLVAFDGAVGKTLSFPRSCNCFPHYCNVEGIHFLNSEMFVAVSDKMKKGGKQDSRCFEKDQSAHVFILP